MSIIIAIFYKVKKIETAVQKHSKSLGLAVMRGGQWSEPYASFFAEALRAKRNSVGPAGRPRRRASP